jgi:hypothetical protein
MIEVKTRTLLMITLGGSTFFLYNISEQDLDTDGPLREH